MSVTLATVADALIEFILSLLRDPEEVKKFDAAPQQVMAAKGLANVRMEDVCAVAPVIADRPDIVVNVQPRPLTDGPDPVVREIRSIINNLYQVDDRDTVIDQSVNQNIWAGGDVTQTFDNEAVAATGDGAIAAGQDVAVDQSTDNSTTITAGADANVGNDTSTTTVTDSYNQQTDSSATTTTTTETTVAPADAGGDAAASSDSGATSSAVQYGESSVDVDADSAYDSSDTAVAPEQAADDEF